MRTMFVGLPCLLGLSLCGALVGFAFPPLLAQSSENGFQSEDLAFFEQKIRPLLIEKCQSCHSSQSKKDHGGLDLDSREAILRGGDNGPAVVVGQPEVSLLVKAIHYRDTDLEMPPDGKLSKRDIALIEDWIRKGLPYPGKSVSVRGEKKIDIQAGKQHWAFQALIPRELPADTSRWSLARHDAFIAEEHGKKGIQPKGPASERELFRRAKLDLIGLPPTPEELEIFLNDPSPDALERSIDEWLASPRYGERWARFWLDLVRYCDIAESWSESQGNSYFYRDWVIRAFNADLPFDRFASLQLAADQLPNADLSDHAALGLIGLSPTYWKELQLPVEIIKSIVSDEYEERIHTLSGTFLGLNIACARCHDHKFDPITTQDYYGLAGVFASTRTADRALQPGIDALRVIEAQQQVKKLEGEVKKVEAEIKKLEAELKKLEAAKSDEKQIDQIEENGKKRESKGKELEELKGKIATTKATPGYAVPLAPAVWEGTLEVKAAVGTHGSRIVYEDAPKDAAIEIRGNPNKLGSVVPRRYVSVLSRNDPQPFSRGSGRADLAEAMFRESTPLIARVIVNRIWKHHFGVGIVETPSDFGTQGDPPSHPALLDDLALRFVQSGWSIKWLHREIVSSATYRLASSHEPIDREYTHAPIRRLDVEAWRDSMLQVTETLELSMGGPSIELGQSQNHRRTVYGTVRRRELTDLLRLHDFPDPITHSPSRIPTTTPLQQLYALNSPFLQEQAVALVSRLHRDAPSSDSERIDRAYQILFGRAPTSREQDLGLRFVQSKQIEDWYHYAQVLLGSNEFLFVD